MPQGHLKKSSCNIALFRSAFGNKRHYSLQNGIMIPNSLRLCRNNTRNTLIPAMWTRLACGGAKLYQGSLNDANPVPGCPG